MVAKVRVTDRDTGFKAFMGSFRSFDGYKISAGVHEDDANQRNPTAAARKK